MPTLSVLELNRIAAALGLDVSLRLFPGGVATRDAGHAGKLSGVLRHVRAPLRWRLEVPRHQLKRRDDPTERFLLVIANTKHNSRVLDELADLFEEPPRLRPGVVRAALEAGEHPATGFVLI